MLSHVFYPAFGNGAKKKGHGQDLSWWLKNEKMVQKLPSESVKNHEDPSWAAFDLNKKLMIRYIWAITHIPTQFHSQNPRGMPWDPRLAAPYPNRKGIVLEPLQRFDNLELMLHHRPMTLHDKGLNTWQSNCSASMVFWGIGESKGCFQVATEGGVSQAEASQSIASQKFGSHVVTKWKNDRAERGAVKSFLFQCCSCLEKTNMIPTIAASKRLFRFCTSKILSFLRKEGTKKRYGSCGGGSWGRTAERSQSTLPKFQGSVDERASHGFPTIQVKVHIFLLPFFKQKTVSRSSAPNARTVLMLIKDSSATLLSSATASWRFTGFQQTTHGIPTHKSWVSAVVTRRTWVELGS